MPARWRSAAAIWARLKNGTRSPAWLETSCHVGQRASVSASRSAEPSAERTRPRKRPKYSTVTRSPSSRSARVKSAISSCAGSWPKAAATSGVSIAISSAAVHGPRARSPASTVRKPDSPAGLRRVGNQPEPKLIAFSVSEKAARSSRVAPSRSGAGGDSAGSVRA